MIRPWFCAHSRTDRDNLHRSTTLLLLLFHFSFPAFHSSIRLIWDQSSKNHLWIFWSVLPLEHRHYWVSHFVPSSCWLYLNGQEILCATVHTQTHWDETDHTKLARWWRLGVSRHRAIKTKSISLPFTYKTDSHLNIGHTYTGRLYGINLALISAKYWQKCQWQCTIKQANTRDILWSSSNNAVLATPGAHDAVCSTYGGLQQRHPAGARAAASVWRFANNTEIGPWAIMCNT